MRDGVTLKRLSLAGRKPRISSAFYYCKVLWNLLQCDMILHTVCQWVKLNMGQTFDLQLNSSTLAPEAGISGMDKWFIPQNTVGYNYLSVPEKSWYSSLSFLGNCGVSFMNFFFFHVKIDYMIMGLSYLTWSIGMYFCICFLLLLWKMKF